LGADWACFEARVPRRCRTDGGRVLPGPFRVDLLLFASPLAGKHALFLARPCLFCAVRIGWGYRVLRLVSAGHRTLWCSFGQCASVHGSHLGRGPKPLGVGREDNFREGRGVGPRRKRCFPRERGRGARPQPLGALVRPCLRLFLRPLLSHREALSCRLPYSLHFLLCAFSGKSWASSLFAGPGKDGLGLGSPCFSRVLLHLWRLFLVFCGAQAPSGFAGGNHRHVGAGGGGPRGPFLVERKFLGLGSPGLRAHPRRRHFGKPRQVIFPQQGRRYPLPSRASVWYGYRGR